MQSLWSRVDTTHEGELGDGEECVSGLVDEDLRDAKTDAKTDRR